MKGIILIRLFLVVTFFLIGISAFAVEENYLWAMEPGFGFDDNYDGRIDIPNTREYATNIAFDVQFEFSDSFLVQNGIDEESLSLAIISASLKNDSVSGVWHAIGEGNSLVVEKLPVGSYHGELSLLYNGTLFSTPVSIEPKRILIAAFGDSYSSGEGAPERRYSSERRSIWADGGRGYSASLDHLRGHRSSQAWPAQTALFLEREDPHSSVIFLFLAVSGAQLDSGALAPYSGVDHTLGGEIPSQIDTLENLVGKQPIDYLYFSLGGNDLGFIYVIIFSLLYGGDHHKSKSHLEKMNQILAGVDTGVWSFPGAWVFTKNEKRLGMDGLYEGYKALNDELRFRFKIGQILMMDYPLPVSLGKGGLTDLLPHHSLDDSEATFFIEKVAVPLLKMQNQICSDFDWTFASAFDEVDSSLHGYSAPAPYSPEDYDKYRFAAPTRWNDFKQQYINVEDPVSFFRTASASILIQGGSIGKKIPSKFKSTGVFHPNEIGYQLMMHQVLRRILLPQGFPAAFQEDYE